MNEYKILFTGTMGAGKSTAINTLSETESINTDVLNSDSSVQKERTTVGLDFGQFTLDNGDRIRMFGTPGQARFDFLWKILSKGSLGLIILADNSRPDPLAGFDPRRVPAMAHPAFVHRTGERRAHAGKASRR